jgi:hypothetical protein
VSTDLITTTGHKRLGSWIALYLLTAARMDGIDTLVGIAAREGIGALSVVYSGGVC